MKEYNDLGIEDKLDLDRIRHLFKISIVASLLVLVGDMLLGSHKQKISESIARDLYGVLFAKGFDHGILATTNGASKNTIKFCNSLVEKPIKIIDVYDILKCNQIRFNRFHLFFLFYVPIFKLNYYI